MLRWVAERLRKPARRLCDVPLRPAAEKHGDEIHGRTTKTLQLLGERFGSFDLFAERLPARG